MDIPDAQAQPQYRPGNDPSVAAGIPGALLSFGLGLPAQLAGNLYGAGKRVTGSSMEDAGKAAQEVIEKFSYKPSPAGEAALEKAGPLMDALIAVQGAMGMGSTRVPTAREAAKSVGRGKESAKASEPVVEPPEKTAPAPAAPEPVVERPFPVEAAKPEEIEPVRPPGPPEKPASVEPPPFPEEAGDLSSMGRFVPDDDFEVVHPPRASRLPRDLAGAKPRYSYGDRQFELTLESDFDRAAYIAAQKTLSKKDAEYVRWAMQESGLSEAEVRAHGAEVRGAIKEMARAEKEGGKLTVEALPRGAREEPPLELTGQTEAEIRADEAVAAKAASEKAKVEAAPPPEDFGLTGSDSPVDAARAAGQMELAPAEEAAAQPEPTVIQHPDGRPWKTKEAARDYMKSERLKGWTVRKQGEGYVLKPIVRTEKQLAAQKKHAAAGKQINVLNDHLADMAGKLGGLSKKALLEMGLDPADLDPKKGSFRSSRVDRPAIRNEGGMSLGQFAEAIETYGFDLRDELGNLDEARIEDLIEEHMTGASVYGYEGYEHQASLQAEARARLDKMEAEARGEALPMTDDEALATFGPGTFGANQFLDPKVIGKAMQDTVRDLFGEPGEHRHEFNPIRDREQHNVARLQRWAAGNGAALRKMAPGEKAQEALTRAIAEDKISELPTEQQAAARQLEAWYRAAGEYMLQAQRIEGLRENYAGPNIWDMNDKNTRRIIEASRAEKGAPGIDMDGMLAQAMRDAGSDPQAFTPFMLQRSISDVFEGMRLGLKPKSLNAADLFETYMKSISTAVERGKALNSLKSLVLDDGSMAVIDREKAPRDYVKVDNPELEGMRIHPDIAPSVRALMETNNPGVIATIAQTLAYTTKRALVSYSMFHPKALLEAYVGSGGNPLTAKTAIDAAIKQYREGGVGDVIDMGLANGLKIGAPIEDVLGRDKFKGVFDKTAKVLDKVGAGKPIRMAKELDEKLQKITWDYLHTGLKLETFSRKYGDLREKYAKDIAAGKVSEKEIARQAAEFTNATYGGLNWERMLDHFDTPIARRIMSEILSKQGRSWMQTFAFAPDWAVSTFGSWTNALGAGEKNALKRQLAQRYLVTSAIITLSIGNALNYYFTGHSMFENKSNKKDAKMGDQMKAKMEVQLGDGRRMQIAKHFMEVPHALADPAQFAANKLNPVIAEPLEQFFNKQYLSTNWAPPITTKKDAPFAATQKRAAHALEKFLPITGRQIMEQGPSGLGGFLGFPIYGLTEEQKKAERAKR